jgi:hypothetical protein
LIGIHASSVSNSAQNTLAWDGDIAQVAECLLCKDEALSSNPSSTKEKKKKSSNQKHWLK